MYSSKNNLRIRIEFVFHSSWKGLALLTYTNITRNTRPLLWDVMLDVIARDICIMTIRTGKMPLGHTKHMDPGVAYGSHPHNVSGVKMIIFKSRGHFNMYLTEL